MRFTKVGGSFSLYIANNSGRWWDNEHDIKYINVNKWGSFSHFMVSKPKFNPKISFQQPNEINFSRSDPAFKCFCTKSQIVYHSINKNFLLHVLEARFWRPCFVLHVQWVNKLTSEDWTEHLFFLIRISAFLILTTMYDLYATQRKCFC